MEIKIWKLHPANISLERTYDNNTHNIEVDDSSIMIYKGGQLVFLGSLRNFYITVE